MASRFELAGRSLAIIVRCEPLASTFDTLCIRPAWMNRMVVCLIESLQRVLVTAVEIASLGKRFEDHRGSSSQSAVPRNLPHVPINAVQPRWMFKTALIDVLSSNDFLKRHHAELSSSLAGSGCTHHARIAS